MTEKERQAKLQYLLNSLSMTKEQKDIVVDLVNNSGSGAPVKDVITIKMGFEDGSLAIFHNDVEIASFSGKPSFDDVSNIITYMSNELYNLFNDKFDNDFIVSSDNNGDQVISNIITKIKNSVAIGFSYITLQNIIYTFVFKKEQ